MLKRIKNFIAKRSTSWNDGDDRWYGDGQLVNPSGEIVNSASAMQLATVYACVRWISQTASSLPFEVIEHFDDGSEQATTDHPLFEPLHYQPNDYMSAEEFWETMFAYQEMEGNGYAEIERFTNGVNAGQLSKIWPLPGRMEVSRRNGVNIYEYTPLGGGQQREIPARDVFHMHSLSLDTLTGITPIRAASESIGLAQAAQRYGATFFGGGGRPKDMLRPKTGSMKPEDQERVLKEWNNIHGRPGGNNTAILSAPMEYDKITVPPEDAQFLETRQVSQKEIAAMFGVPPHKVGILEDATFSNIEQQNIEAVTDAITPRVRRVEQLIRRMLITEEDRKRYSVRFNVNGLLRGDIKTRFEAYRLGIMSGFMNRNEARKLESLNRADGLDEFVVQVNQMNSDVIVGQESLGDTSSGDEDSNDG
jgi:HK97 family phage portal protein